MKESDMDAFVEAAHEVCGEQMKTIHFVCPICGGEAEVFKDKDDRHIASCHKCNTRFMEGI